MDDLIISGRKFNRLIVEVIERYCSTVDWCEIIRRIVPG